MKIENDVFWLSRNRFFLFAATRSAGRAILEADRPGIKSHLSASVPLGILGDLVFIPRAFCDRHHYRERLLSLP
jgi:hypothetical protein